MTAPFLRCSLLFFLAAGCTDVTASQTTSPLTITQHVFSDRLRIAVLSGPHDARLAEMIDHVEDYDVVVTEDLEIPEQPSFPSGASYLAVRVLYPFYYQRLHKVWDDGPPRRSSVGVYSRLPFVEMELPTLPPADGSEAFAGEDANGPISCVRLANGMHECPSTLAVKGYRSFPASTSEMPGLVRVNHGGHITNIVFTGLDVDQLDTGVTSEDGRKQGLEAIHQLLAESVPSALTDPMQDIVVAGNLQIEGFRGSPELAGSPLENPNAKLLDSEYGKTIWSELDGLPFFDAWRTTSAEDDGVTDVSGRLFGEVPWTTDAQRRHDQPLQRRHHALLYGGGYHVPGAAELDRAGFTSGARQCPQWVRRIAHRQLPTPGKRHEDVLRGFILELGPRGVGCRADLPIRPVFPANGITLQSATIDEPGQTVWYRVDAPGTYSIGLEPAAAGTFTAAVFAARDLSRPLPAIRADGKRIMNVASCPGLGLEQCEFEVESYLINDDQPFYVRVHAPTGTFTGRPALLIRRNDCSSEDVKCWLAPGEAPRVSNANVNQHDFFYAFATHRAYNGAAQTFEVEVAVTAGIQNATRATLSSAVRGVVLPTRAVKTRYVGKFEESGVDQYLLHVRREGASIHQVQWRTNLTFLFGASAGFWTKGTPATLGVYCKDETEGDALGDDEIRLTVGDSTHFTRFWPGIDAGDPAVSFDDMPPLAYVGEATLTISELSTEYDSDEIDQQAEIVIPSLDPRVRERLNQTWNTPLHSLDADDNPDPSTSWGAYEVTINQSHSPHGGQP